LIAHAGHATRPAGVSGRLRRKHVACTWSTRASFRAGDRRVGVTRPESIAQSGERECMTHRRTHPKNPQ
jgi:hypothetical protein